MARVDTALASSAFIPVAKPWMGEVEAEAARRPIMAGWVTQGPEVAAFEREFAAYVGAEHACAVSNCTTALHLALRAAGVGPGDEVITASHSFIATANSIRYCDAVPIFVDIQPETFNLDPALVAEAISPRTRAILCVHQIGMPCDLQALAAIGRQHALPVIEDAACAVGSEILWDGRWERIGKPHGDAACFSFHPRKLLTTGDGGMITTNNSEWDAKFRLWRQHSMGVPDSVRHKAGDVVFEDYTELGYNYRMTDIQAAIGREQLKRLPSMVEQRREQVERYRQLLADVPGLALPHEPAWARSNWQSFCVRLPELCDQRGVMQRLLDAGIATRRGIMCAHREPAYQVEPWSCGAGPGACGCASRTCRRLQHSEQAQDRSILLPLFHQMTGRDQDRVAAALREACTA
jgi:dTDP-4-amino-4,6-dideoxygalactose transaminase